MKGVSMGKLVLLALQVNLVRKCKEFKICLCQPAAVKFLTCKARALWLYGVDIFGRRKLSKQNSPPWETPQGQWFPSLLGRSPGTLQPGETSASCWGMQNFPPQSQCLCLFSLFFPSYIFLPGAHWGGKQSVGRRCSPVQHQGKQLPPLPFSGWLENYPPVGWFPSTCSAPLWIFMLLY